MFSNQHLVTITEEGILSLLQISDSFFPTGSFSHSYGLETYVQKELINSKETLAQFLKVYLLESIATSDCLALTLAHRAAEIADLAEILKLDQILSAQKLARESREASIKTGNRMMRVVSLVTNNVMLLDFCTLVLEGKTHGHHAVVFGLAAQVLGLGIKEAALAYIYNAMAGMVNNAVRLVPLGQNEGQLVLTSLQGTMLETVNTSLKLHIEDLGSATPALEIRSMQHERLYSRLFMS
ncbi:urease accessory protein UreF [Desulfosporosinus sp. SB140]|uniref:urease accessory protein UreF n=1 Tax=Desulfosporosinus paludis TaxID=3115649 RepID=UPI00388F01E4